MSVSRFIVLCALAVCVPVASAQISTRQLLQNSVEKIDERYKDVDDAVVMFQRNNPTVALSLLQKAAKTHSELPPAEVMYAHLCFGNNKIDAGRAILELAVVRVESDAEPWIMLADLAMRGGRLAEADLLFQRGLEKISYMKPDTKRLHYLQIAAHAGLAQVDERRGLWDQAESHLSRWIELEPENTDALSRFAGVCFSQKKFDDAKTKLTKIREIDESRPLPEVVMGVLHQRAGQQDESEKMMAAALEKGADDPITLIAVAEWALTAGKVDMARDQATKVLDLNTDASRAELVLGRVQRFEGDHAGAETAFRKMYESSPASFAVSNELALAIFAQNDADKYKQALQYAQVNAGRYKDIRTGRGRQAAATLAYGLYRIGQNAAAEKVIQNVVTSGEISPQIGYFAAMIFKTRGRVDLAQKILSQALASYVAFPEQESARKLLAALGEEATGQKTEKGKAGETSSTDEG